MKKLTEIYDIFDVVVVPFPFTDIKSEKRRPALILSSSTFFDNSLGASVMAMITTASHNPWPLDIEILDLITAGLSEKSIIRMKLFTLDHRLILKKIGYLGKKDQIELNKNLKSLFQL